VRNIKCGKPANLFTMRKHGRNAADVAKRLETPGCEVVGIRDESDENCPEPGARDSNEDACAGDGDVRCCRGRDAEWENGGVRGSAALKKEEGADRDRQFRLSSGMENCARC